MDGIDVDDSSDTLRKSDPVSKEVLLLALFRFESTLGHQLSSDRINRLFPPPWEQHHTS